MNRVILLTLGLLLSFATSYTQTPPITVNNSATLVGENVVLEISITNDGTIPATFGFGGLTLSLNGSAACLGDSGVALNALPVGDVLNDTLNNSVATAQGGTSISIQLNADSVGPIAPGDTEVISEVLLELQDPLGCTCPNDFQINSSLVATFLAGAPTFGFYTSVDVSSLNPSTAFDFTNSFTAPAVLPTGPQRAGTILQFESEYPGTWQVNSLSAGIYETAPLSDQAELVFYSEATAPEIQQVELINGVCTLQVPVEVAPSRKVDVRAYLAGPYNDITDLMRTNLNPTLTSPSVDLLDQQYLFGATGHPDLGIQTYDGQQMSEFAAVPNNAVDIVRIAIRQDGAINALDRIAVGYGWLLENGDIVDFYSGGRLDDFVNCTVENSANPPFNDFRVSVHHRAHLPVRNASPAPAVEVDFAVPTTTFDYTITGSGTDLNITSPGTPSTRTGWPFNLGVESGGFGRVLTAGSAPPYRVLMISGQATTPSWEFPNAFTNAMDYFYFTYGQGGGFITGSGTGVFLPANPINVYHNYQEPNTAFSVDLNLDGVINSLDVSLSEFTANSIFNVLPLVQRP